MKDKWKDLIMLIVGLACGMLIVYFLPEKTYKSLVLGFLAYLYWKTPFSQ